MNITWNSVSRGIKFTIQENGIKIRGKIDQQSPGKPFYITSSDLVLQRKVFLKDDNSLKGLSKEKKIELVKEEAVKTIKQCLEKKKLLMEKIIEGDYKVICSWNPYVYDDFLNFGYIEFKIENYEGQISIQPNLNHATLTFNWLFKDDVYLSFIDEEKAKEESYNHIKKRCSELIEILKAL